jgi:CheY-like chemotaxis protein
MAKVSADTKRILVVEDNEDTRAILHALLTHHGYHMLATATAEDMLERFEELDPDLIVMDVRLPGMDGCEALEHVRKRGYAGPAFLFSEYYDLIAERIKGCPHDGFFPKSKGPLELVATIGRWLRGPTPAS